MTTARAKAAFRGETASLGETTARAETAAPKAPTLKTEAPTNSVPVTSVLATPVPATPGAPPRLSDAALLLLGQAAAREDRLLLPPPPALRTRGSALQKVLQALLKAGLVTEVPVATEAQSWRSGADGARIGLVIAVEGFRAIGLAVPAPAAPAPVAPVSAAITAGQGTPAAEPTGRITKQATLIAMLSDDAGASVPTLSETLKWQIHTVRAALTGLRQKGHELARTKDAAGTTIYRITGRASAEAAGATGATGATGGAAVMGA